MSRLAGSTRETPKAKPLRTRRKTAEDAEKNAQKVATRFVSEEGYGGKDAGIVRRAWVADERD
jgi:hypothetical protein